MTIFQIFPKPSLAKLSSQKAIVGRTITLDFTGERMRSEDASNAQGRWTGSSFAHKDGWTHQQKPLQFDFPESNLIKLTQNSLLES